MWFLFNDRCDCHIINDNDNEDEAAGCYICSPHFRMIPFLLKLFWGPSD
jgi:hypothetical protein